MFDIVDKNEEVKHHWTKRYNSRVTSNFDRPYMHDTLSTDLKAMANKYKHYKSSTYFYISWFPPTYLLSKSNYNGIVLFVLMFCCSYVMGGFSTYTHVQPSNILYAPVRIEKRIIQLLLLVYVCHICFSQFVFLWLCR